MDLEVGGSSPLTHPEKGKALPTPVPFFRLGTSPLPRNGLARPAARLVEDAVEAWKADHAEAMHVRQVEALVQVCGLLRGRLRQWQKEAWEALFGNRIRNPPAGPPGDLAGSPRELPCDRPRPVTVPPKAMPTARRPLARPLIPLIISIG